MTPRYMQLVALRAQVDALIAAEMAEAPSAPDPEMCLACGASGEGTQADTSTLDGTRKRTCVVCRAERVL